MYPLFGSDWFRRRWLDFRNGHSPYLAGVFNNIIIFAIVFVLMYVPIGIVLGYWHRKTQWKVEQDALFRENKVGAIMWMYVIDLIEGNVSEEDKKLMKEALLGITRGETRLYRTSKLSKNDGKIEDSPDK
jgi:hypothetical protein